MSAAAHDRTGTDWSAAAHLVARMLVLVGLGLALLGLGRTGYIVFEARRGLETLATIETAAPRSGGGGLVQLSWQEPNGELRRAADVGVSRALGRKLRIGNALWRENLRIRYRPGLALATPLRDVVVLDDVPERVKSAAALAIGGCLALSGGSFLVLMLLLGHRLRRATRPVAS